MARAVLLLLAGVGIGFFLGRSTRETRPVRPETDRSRRTAMLPGPATEVRPAQPKRAAGVVGKTAPASGVVVQDLTPAEREDAEEGHGWIVVDFSATPKPWRMQYAVRTLNGGREIEDHDAEDDGRATIEIPAGPCDIWWIERQSGRRHGATVTVEDGRVVRLRAADPALAGHVSPGLGVLGLRTLDEAGRPLSVRGYVEPAAGGSGMRIDTVAGAAAVDLIPGAYVVRLGAATRRAEVRAGEQVDVVFRPDREGVLVLPENLWRAALYRDGRLAAGRKDIAVVEGRRRFPYVPPGSYELVVDSSQRPRRGFGPYLVKAGEVTVADERIAHLDLRFSAAGKRSPRVFLREVAPLRLVHVGHAIRFRGRWQAVIAGLRSGPYEVEILVAGRSLLRRAVEAGDGRQVLDLD